MSPLGGKTIDLLTVKIGADIDEALKGLEGIGSGVKKVAGDFVKFAAAATAVGVGLTALAVKTGQWADELLDLRDQTGLTLKELQEFRAVAIQAGVGPDTIAEAVQKLQQRMASGAEGSADLRFALKELGISMTDSGGRTRAMGEIVNEALGKLGDMEDVTQRNVTAYRLFGRGAADILPVLGMGSEEMRKAIERAHKLGLVMGDENVEAANAFRQEWDFLRAGLEAAGRELSIITMPALTSLAAVSTDVVVPALGAGVQGLNAFIKGLGIMGAEAAVAVAEIELAFAKLDEDDGLKGFFTRLSGLGEGAGLFDPLGLDLFSKVVGADLGKSVSEAEAHLARMRAAADAVSFEIVELGTRTRETAAVVANVAVPGFENLTVKAVELQLSLRALPKEFEDLTRTVEDLTVEVAALTEEQQVWVGNLTEGLMDITDRTGSVADAFSDMIHSIIEDLARLQIQKSLESIILGQGGFGGLALGVGLAFAGGFEHGGTIGSGQFGLVGERGPELISGPASVTPSGGGVQHIHHHVQHLNLNAIDGRDARRFLEENKHVLAGLMLEMRRESSLF